MIETAGLQRTADIFAQWAPMILLDDATPRALDDMEPFDPSAPDALHKAAGAAVPRTKDGKSALPASVRIGGIMSSESPDLQGDIVMQNGLDCRYWLKKGWLNWEHERGPEYIVGYPDKTFPTKDEHGAAATGFEAHLLLDEDHPHAMGAYRTMAALRKAGDHRRIGISIEGPPPMRSPNNRKVILKSIPMNASICSHPISPESRVELFCKAMGLADIGVQTPASGGGSLGALVPQSLGYLSASEQYALAERRKRAINADDLAGMLCKAFPGLSYSNARLTAVRMCQMAPYTGR